VVVVVLVVVVVVVVGFGLQTGFILLQVQSIQGKFRMTLSEHPEEHGTTAELHPEQHGAGGNGAGVVVLVLVATVVGVHSATCDLTQFNSTL
jgi:hypothetical protein